MKQFGGFFAELFSLMKLKKRTLFILFGVLAFVTCLRLFIFQMEQIFKTTSDPSVLKQRHLMERDAFIAQKLEKYNKKQQWKPEFRGKVNMHVFEDWCGSSIEQLRKNVLYPLFPHTRTTLNRLALYPKWKNYGLRIFGFIHPPFSGEYIFAISSDKNSEFWLSQNESPQSLRLLAYIGKTGAEWSGPGEYGKFSSQTSQPITLLGDMRYFFEVVFKHNEGIDHLEVAWRLNEWNGNFSTFTVITSEHLSLYAEESSLLAGDTADIPQTIASHEMYPDLISKQSEPEVDMVREDPRDSIYEVPLMNESHLKDTFPECDYKPINVVNEGKIQRFHGIYYVHYSAVYPNDRTRQTHTPTDEMCFYTKDKAYNEGGGLVQFLKLDNTGEAEEKNKKPDPNWERVIKVSPVDFHSKQPTQVTSVCTRAGNVIMDEKEVMPVVKAFMTQLKSGNVTRKLKRVVNVERRMNKDVGSRYLLELELEDDQGRNMLLSRYFYSTKATNKEGSPSSEEEPALCSPKDFSWNPDAKVHVILPVKNQGRWVIQFIRQMEKVYKATGDNNFNVFIVDYSSNDIDIPGALQNATLPSYQYKRLEGTFLKTTAIQTAIDLIEDGNSILFTCDLHLHFPVSIIHIVRKHCVQGKMIFAPAVMRLDCGATAQAPSGFWEIDGYGLIGIYKSDMARIGGMNTRDFKDKWGGEDWELLDRIVENKLEVERLNLRNFLHFHHSKRGMWNS